MGTRAAIYARLSRNRGSEQSASTQRQVAACRKLAEERGLEVVQVEVDDDTSAYSGKPRPGYSTVMELMESDAIDALLAWAPDRLHRSPRELEDFVDTVEEHAVDVITCQSGRVDLSTPAGRLHARNLSNIARYESEHRSARTVAAHEQIAADGRWKGGPRPYGYEQLDKKGNLRIVPAEAKIVREAARRIIAGERPGSVATDLNRRGVPTSKNTKWTTPTIRNMVASPTVAGRRSYKGEDVGPAAWKPILDADTSRAVRSVMDSGVKRGRVPRIALFTGGRLICGRCGGPMSSARKGSGVRAYRCTQDYLMVVAEPLEDLVVEAMLRRLDAVEFDADEADEHGLGDQLDVLETELAALAEDLGAGRITRAEWLAARTPLTERIATARGRMAEVVESTTLAGIAVPGAVRAAWPELSLSRRQGVVDLLIDAVVVNPAASRGPKFDPDRVDVRWRY